MKRKRNTIEDQDSSKRRDVASAASIGCADLPSGQVIAYLKSAGIHSLSALQSLVQKAQKTPPKYSPRMTKELHGKTPDKIAKLLLITAIWYGDVEEVRILIHGNPRMDLNEKIELQIDQSTFFDGWTLFHLACWCGDLKIAKFLIDSNADPSATDDSQSNGMLIAAQSGNVQLFEFLFDSDLNYKQQNGYGKSLIHFVCESGNPDIVKYFLSQVENPDQIRLQVNYVSNYKHPLNLAVQAGNLATVKVLIEAKADVNARPHDGTCLHDAEDNRDILKTLINAGADIEKPSGDCFGDPETPLQYACIRSYLNAVELLIAHKSDVSKV